MNFKNKSLKISAPKEKVLYGIVIRKLPVGKYIKVLAALEELPQLLIGKAFEGRSLTEISLYLKTLNKDNCIDLITRLLAVVPEELMQLLSDLLDIPLDRLISDGEDALGLTELTKILVAFWDINDMTDFFVTARRMAGRMKAVNIGTNDGSQSPRASE